MTAHMLRTDTPAGCVRAGRNKAHWMHREATRHWLRSRSRWKATTVLAGNLCDVHGKKEE